LNLLQAQIQQAVMFATGMVPGMEGQEGANVTSAGDGEQVLPGLPEPDENTMNQLIQRAYGARLAQRRTPEGE